MKKAGLIACALVAMLMCSCDIGKYEVSYRAWGSASDVKIRYYDDDENEVTLYNQSLPFNYDFRTNAGDQWLTLSVTREHAAQGSEAHVEIVVNGVLIGEGSDYVSSGGDDFLLAQTGICLPNEVDGK